MKQRFLKQRLTEGNIGKQLIQLTIPMVVGVFAMMGFNLADAYFVGQLGTKQLAAMSFTFPVVMALGALAMGLGVGASSVIARAIGEGEHDRVQKFTTHSLTLGVVTVVIFVSLGLFTIDPLFTALGASTDVLPLIREYMQIWYIGMIFLMTAMMGNSAIRASGNTAVPAIVMMVATVLNIVLDPILIFGLAGFPRLELQGAALATAISRAVTLVAALLFLHFKERMLCLKLPSLKETLWCWKDILYVGLPATGTRMITPISIGVITRLIAKFGASSVAAFGITSRIESLSLITVMALSMSIGPFIGQNWGAQKYTRIRKALQLSFIFCIAWGGIIALILFPLAPFLVSLFNKNPDVIEIAARYLWIVPISYGSAGVILVATSAFDALGKPIPSIVMALMRMFVLYIPLAYFGEKIYGINGIFAAASISSLVVGIGAYIWNQKTCNLKASEKVEQTSSVPKI